MFARPTRSTSSSRVRRAALGGLVSFAVAVGGLAIPVPGAPTASADLAPKAECSTYFQNASGDQMWSTAANWSTGAVPTDVDVACVIDETAVFDGAAVVRQLHGNGTVVMTTGYLELLEVSDIVNVDLQGGVLRVDARLAPYSFTQSGGTLNGPGELVVGGSFVWSGGHQGDPVGYTLVEGEATVTTTSILTWTDRQLLVNGELTAFGPGVIDFGGAVVRIADASFQAGHVSVVGSDLRFSDGEVLGSVSLPAGTPIEGEWTVGPDATLQIATSEISGAVQVEAGGSLQIVDLDTDEYVTTLTPTGSITGEGEIYVEEETQFDVHGTVFTETLRSGGAVRLFADAVADDLRTGGQLVLEDDVTLTVVELVIDDGVVAVPDSSTVVGAQATRLFGTGELMLDGLLQGDLVQSEGTLRVDSSSASIRGSYTQNGGTLQLGVDQEANSSLTVEFDTVLGGVLELEAANPVHRTAPILYTTTLTGQFSEFVAGSGLCADIAYEADRVMLESVYCPQVSPIVAPEGNGLATFSVSIHEPLDTPYEFTYETGDVSAVAESDYVAASGTAVIPAGSTSVGIEVEILDDDVVEDDEDFGLSIVGPLESAVALELATIVDDDDRAGFEQYFQFHGLGARGNGLYPTGMNANGVVGHYSTDADTGYSWFWSFEEKKVDHILGLELSSPMDVTENGDILTTAAVRHRGGVITLLSAVPGIPTWSGATAYAINETGVVAGVAWPDRDMEHAVLVQWSADNAATILATPAANWFEVSEINDDGVIVGWVILEGATEGDAFRYSDAGFEILPRLDGATYATAYSINDDGVIVGSSGGHAVMWAPDGTITDLGAGWASDINSDGAIVGSSPSIDDPSTSLATIWFEGHRFEVNDYVPDRAGWNLVQALEINDDGAIAGKARLASGSQQTYVLEPLECFICVEFSFMEPDVDQPGGLVPVDGGVPATEGDPVKLEAQVVNHVNVTQSVDIWVHDSLTGEPLHEEPFTRVLAPGGRATIAVDIDTNGMAWSNGIPADPRQFEITVADADTGVEIKSVIAGLTVDPRPIVLVHGLWSDASTWAEYQAFATAAHPRWKVYAVDTMDTASTFPKTVSENAAQVAAFIEGIRSSRNIWSVDVVGHSMGGLISRYYIHHMMPSYQGPNSSFGIPAVDRLVMLGTPNAGSPCALLSPFPATFELRPDVVALFNSTVTERRGVEFSVAAGYNRPYTCASPFRGDDVVPEFSAAFGIEDVSYVDDMPHTSMTGSNGLFTDFVLPRLNGTAVAPADFFRTAAPMSVGAEEAPPDMQALYLDTLDVAPDFTDRVGITVPASAAAVAVTVTAGDLVGAELVDPFGVVRSSFTAEATPDAYPSFRSLSAPAMAGRWIVRIINTDPENQQAVGIGVAAIGTPIVLEVDAEQVHWSGRLAVSAEFAGPADQTPAVLDAELRDATGAETTFALFDDGLHGDGAADDGRYRAIVRDVPAGGALVTVQVIKTGVMLAASAGVAVTIPSTPPANTAPTATPMTIEVGRDAPQRIVLEGVDPDGDDLVVSAVSTPAHGTLSGITPNVLYTPAAGYTGPDSFTFTVTDGALTSAPATVTVDVGAAPVEIDYDGPWPASGGQGEEVTLRARLVDATRAGVPNVPVTFHLGDEEWTSTTSTTGHGSVVVTVDLEPGEHELVITSEATATYRAGEHRRSFTVIASRAPTPLFSHQYGDEAGYTVRFMAIAGDPDGDSVAAEWDFDGDGVVDTTTGAPDGQDHIYVNHVYANEYHGPATVTVIDSKGNRGSATFDANVKPYRPLGSLSRLTVHDDLSVEAVDSDEDGRHVLYIEPVPGSANPIRERLAVLDRSTGQSEIASISADGEVVETVLGALSPDGRYVAFTAFGENGFVQVYLRDLAEDTTTLVTGTQAGEEGNERSRPVAISRNADKVLFTSDATDLADIPCTYDCTYQYVWDRATGDIELVSILPDGSAAHLDSTATDISADGTHVAFDSRLVAGSLFKQQFVRDLVTGETALVSVALDGGPANHDAQGGQLSADGSKIVFVSIAGNLVPGDTNSHSDAFVRDLRTGVTRSVSLTAKTPGGSNFGVDISGDGTLVVFGGLETNGSGDGSVPMAGVYLADLVAGTAELLSRDVRDDLPADHESYVLHSGRWITCDGSAVLFRSLATNLVPGDVTTGLDSFVAKTGLTRGCPTGDEDDPNEDPDTDPPVNRAPVAVGTSTMTTEDTAVDIALDASDPDGDELDVEVVTAPSNGAVTGIVDGTVPGIRYAPKANWSGTDHLTVRVTDPDGLQSDVVTVTIQVTPVNDVPTCSDLVGSTTAGVAVTLTASCTDQDGDALTLSVGSVPTDVTVNVIGNRLTVVPASAGTKTFTYRANDGTATSSPASVTLTVVPAPVPPAPPVTGSLLVSANARRSEPVPLEGAVLQGTNVHVFLQIPEVQGAIVVFLLDGRQVFSESKAPYDFRGTLVNGSAGAWEPGQLNDGRHVITAELRMTNGEVITHTATFTIV